MKRRITSSMNGVPDLSDYLHNYVKSIIVDVEDLFDAYIKENIVDWDEFTYDNVDEYAEEVYEYFIKDVELAEPSVEYLIILDMPKEVVVRALSHELYFQKKVMEGN